ncbi:unnamed protein product, partial [Ectocarpus sp. 12 AP-2014]
SFVLCSDPKTASGDVCLIACPLAACSPCQFVLVVHNFSVCVRLPCRELRRLNPAQPQRVPWDLWTWTRGRGRVLPETGAPRSIRLQAGEEHDSSKAKHGSTPRFGTPFLVRQPTELGAVGIPSLLSNICVVVVVASPGAAPQGHSFGFEWILPLHDLGH